VVFGVSHTYTYGIVIKKRIELFLAAAVVVATILNQYLKIAVGKQG
jgi:hypothetical protein